MKSKAKSERKKRGGSSSAAHCSAADLRIALDESVKLQAHYAKLINYWDGGHRMIFKDAAAWIARLRETRTLPPNAKLTGAQNESKA